MLLAFIPMCYQHLTANIMSLGGIAVAIGAMVDASIIIIENIHKKLDEWEAPAAAEAAQRRDHRARCRRSGRRSSSRCSSSPSRSCRCSRSKATEGRLFKPLAFTKTYSMGFAAILAVTLTPALAVLFIRGKIHDEQQEPAQPLAHRGLRARGALRRRPPLAGASWLALLAIVLTVPAFFRLGSEFMPPLNEGVILYMPTAPPGHVGERGGASCCRRWTASSRSSPRS